MTTLSSAGGSVAPSHHPRSAAAVFGGLLMVTGLVLLLAEAGFLVSPWPVVPGLLLVAVGVAVTVEGARGVWHGGLVTIGVILTLFMAVTLTASNTLDVSLSGTGDRAFAPEAVTELPDSFELGAGQLDVDLSQLVLPEGTTPVIANVGMGELRVRVPAEVPVDIDAELATGEIQLFDEVRGGLGVDLQYTSPGYDTASRRLQVRLDAGMGRIEVTR